MRDLVTITDTTTGAAGWRRCPDCNGDPFGPYSHPPRTLERIAGVWVTDSTCRCGRMAFHQEYSGMPTITVGCAACGWHTAYGLTGDDLKAAARNHDCGHRDLWVYEPPDPELMHAATEAQQPDPQYNLLALIGSAADA